MISPEMLEKLAAPFPSASLRWRAADATKKNCSTDVVCYVDARAIMDRLDEVFGGDWSFDWEPVLTGTNKNGTPIIISAKGTITAGGVSKSDIGDNANYEPNKAAVSDALKRAAVHFRIGRYLYSMPHTVAQVDGGGKVRGSDRAALDAAHAKLVQAMGKEAPASPDAGVDEATVLRSVLLDVMPEHEALIVQMDAPTARKKVVAGLRKGMAAGKKDAA